MHRGANSVVEAVCHRFEAASRVGYVKVGRDKIERDPDLHVRDSATADALEAIVDLDLTFLADVEPPRGYGRD